MRSIGLVVLVPSSSENTIFPTKRDTECQKVLKGIAVYDFTQQRKRDKLKSCLKEGNQRLVSKMFLLQQRFFEDLDLMRFHIHNKKLELKTSTRETIKKWKGEDNLHCGPITLEIGSDVESSFIVSVEDSISLSRYLPTNNTQRQFSKTEEERNILNNKTTSSFQKISTKELRTYSGCSNDFHIALECNTTKYFTQDESFLNYIDRQIDPEDTFKDSPISNIRSSLISETSLKNGFETDPSTLGGSLGTASEEEMNIRMLCPNNKGMLKSVTLERPFNVIDVEKKTTQAPAFHNPTNENSESTFVWEFRDGNFVKVPCDPLDEKNMEWDVDNENEKSFSLRQFLHQKRLKVAERMYELFRQKYLNEPIVCGTYN